MKRSRPVALLCLIVYLCTATGLAQASLLGHFNSATYPQEKAESAQAKQLPLHEAEPAFTLDLSSLIQNGNLQGSTEDVADFLLICATLVTWPASLPSTTSFVFLQTASPPFRSDPLLQFSTLSLQI